MLETMRIWGAAAVIALLVAGSASADTIKFVFDKPADAEGWTAASKRWKVKDQAYRPFQKADGFAATVLDKPNFSDLEYTVTAKEHPMGSFFGGLIRGKVKAGAASGYLAILTNDDGEKGTLYFYKLNKFAFDGMGGEFITLCQEIISPLGTGKSVTILAEGNDFQVFYNGTLKCETSDTSYSKGKVGLMSGYGPTAVATYRSVKIETP